MLLIGSFTEFRFEDCLLVLFELKLRIGRHMDCCEDCIDDCIEDNCDDVSV